MFLTFYIFDLSSSTGQRLLPYIDQKNPPEDDINNQIANHLPSISINLLHASFHGDLLCKHVNINNLLRININI